MARKPRIPVQRTGVFARSWRVQVNTFRAGLLKTALRAAGGNQTHAAELLQMGRSTFVQAMHDADAAQPAEFVQEDIPAPLPVVAGYAVMRAARGALVVTCWTARDVRAAMKDPALLVLTKEYHQAMHYVMVLNQARRVVQLLPGSLREQGSGYRQERVRSA